MDIFNSKVAKQVANELYMDVLFKIVLNKICYD